MVEQDPAELRGQLASTQELLAEIRHQRDLLEQQLAESETAQRELRRALLERRQDAELTAPLGRLVLSPEPGVVEAREPTLGEWWRDIDRLRRIGASCVLSALVSFVAAAGFHFLLSAHLISPIFRLGYVFALIGILLLIVGVGMLF